jgi:hypothetical protein
MRVGWTVAAVAALGLQACVPQGGAGGGTVVPSTAPDACGAAALQDLVGRPITDFEAMSMGPKTLRVLRPGDAMTLDFSETRLNVDVDQNGNISRIWCG